MCEKFNYETSEEEFLIPTDYNKFFEKDKVSCTSGILMNYFQADLKSSILSQTLFEFYKIVNSLIEDYEILKKDFCIFTDNKGRIIKNKNEYKLKSILSFLFSLKYKAYINLHIMVSDIKEKLLKQYDCNQIELAISEAEKRNIFTKQESEIFTNFFYGTESDFYEDFHNGNCFIEVFPAENDKEISFGIYEFTNDSGFDFTSEYEIKSGILMNWAADELYRLYKLTHIVSKFITGNADLDPTVVSSGEEASELINIFTRLVK